LEFQAGILNVGAAGNILKGVHGQDRAGVREDHQGPYKADHPAHHGERAGQVE